MAAKCAALLRWFEDRGGFLNPALTFKYDSDNGYHFVAKESMSKDSKACVCPFPVTLSHLNLLPNPPAGIPSYNHKSVCSALVNKLEHDIAAHFFLIEQRLRGTDSIWYEYIDALPKEHELTTPLYFKPEDLVWLYGTQQYNKNVPPERTAVGLRTADWRQQWQSGLQILEKHTDASKYTWELYKWAATIFSSRSFTSQIYGDRNDIYPILYPVLDCFNHRFGEKVNWNMGKMDDKSFSLCMSEATEAGQQVYNNYAPKNNDELLLGYGFAIENSPCDEVGMRMAQPPPTIHEALMHTMPFHYKSKEFDAAEFTFRIRGSRHYSAGCKNRMRDYGITCMRGIPENLALTLQMFASYQIIPESEDPMRKEGELWYAALDILLDRLQNIRGQIRQWDDKLPPKPQNKCQAAAKIYRDGQLAILEEVIAEFEAFLGPLEQGMDYMDRFGRLVRDQYFRTYS